jgi:integrase
MLGKQAKVLAPDQLADLLAFADCSRHPLRNRVMVLLSTKAGLRAGEIANLTWDMVLDASGQLSNGSNYAMLPPRSAAVDRSQCTSS